MVNQHELSVNCHIGRVYIDACGYFVIPTIDNTTYCSIVIIGHSLWKRSESGNRYLIKEASKKDTDLCLKIIKEHNITI